MSKRNETEPLEATHVDVTQGTLDATPEKTLKLLRGIGTVPAIRAALATKGYDDAEHAHGWKLVLEVSGYRASPPEVKVDPRTSDAIHAIDTWDEEGFRTITASLKHRFPKQLAFLMEGIGPSTGMQAVANLKLLLERLDSLEKGHRKNGSGDHDKAAMALLAKRGINPAKRAELAKLVAEAESLPAADGLESADKTKARVEKRLADLQALRAWYEEWSELAHAAIKRRDHLIFLGLAKRKPRKKASAATQTPSGAPATPTGAKNTAVTS